MINWNEVKVGETEIEWGGGVYLVIGIFKHWVWLLRNGNPIFYSLAVLKDATIRDPWEEITDHRWIQVEYTGGSRWKLMRGDLPIYVDDIHYKSDGRRVWKRKEGI